MLYRRFPPLPALAGDVICGWSLRDEAGAPPLVERVVPDGHMELVIHLGETFRWRTRARWQVQGEAVLFGQIAAPLLLSPGSRVHTLGVRFRVAGARPFFAVDLDELAGQPTPLADLVGAAPAAELLEQLPALSDDAGRLEHVQRWLLARRRGADDGVVRGCVAMIVARRGGVRVADLARRAAIGERQLARRFRAAVGLAPKQLARIVRLQSALRAYDARRGWADVALAAGYADQAHLIRDFVDLAGQPPAALIAEAGPFTMSETSNPPISPPG